MLLFGDVFVNPERASELPAPGADGRACRGDPELGAVLAAVAGLIRLGATGFADFQPLLDHSSHFGVHEFGRSFSHEVGGFVTQEHGHLGIHERGSSLPVQQPDAVVRAFNDFLVGNTHVRDVE